MIRKDATCPSCEAKRYWRIERVFESAYEGSGYSPLAPAFTRMAGFVGGHAPIGHFRVYICASCGFTEWYAMGIEALVHDPANGVELCDGTSSGPRSGYSD